MFRKNISSSIIVLSSISTDGTIDVQYGSPPCGEIARGVYESQRAASDPAHAPWLPVGLRSRARGQNRLSAAA